MNTETVQKKFCMIRHHHQASAIVNVFYHSFCLPSLVVHRVEMGEAIVIFTCLFFFSVESAFLKAEITFW